MNKNEKFVKLISTNLTKLGGPMGSESTSTNWIKYFESDLKQSAINKAKEFAQNNYKKGKIRWRNDYHGGLTSGDLAFVEYTIEPILFL